MLSKEQWIGIVFVGFLVLLLVAIEVTVGTGILHPRYLIYADFPDVQGLDTGADVRLAGIKVGRVDGMKIVGDHVQVGLEIGRGFEVKKDAVARLDFRALSGERFVSITLGTPTAPALKPGSTIQGETPASFTEAVDRLNQVAISIQELAEDIGENGRRLLATLADVVEENREALTATAHNIESITAKLDRGVGTLGRLLNDPALYDEVTASLAEVRSSAKELGDLARKATAGDGTVAKLLADRELYDQARDAAQNLSEAARNVQEITEKLNAGEGTLGRMVNDEDLYEQAQDTLRAVNRATQSIEDQGPISVLGTIATSLF